ncbi:MAG: hypothetical protein ACLPWG_06680 [Steroidobacteraceae bacterium]
MYNAVQLIVVVAIFALNLPGSVARLNVGFAWVSRSPLWLYPLLFALPTLGVGIFLLVDGNSTFLGIGAATFGIGFIAAIVTKRFAMRV